MLLPLLAALPLVVIAFAARWLRMSSRRRRSLPPGPKGYPVIGNIMDLPKEKAWLGYHELSKQYGEYQI